MLTRIYMCNYDNYLMSNNFSIVSSIITKINFRQHFLVNLPFSFIHYINVIDT